MDPFTLKFINPDGDGVGMDSADVRVLRLEKEYFARKFAESHTVLVVGACALFTKLLSVLAVCLPATRISCVAGTCVSLVLSGGRLWLRRRPDQEQAHQLFAWAWCYSWLLTTAGLTTVHWILPGSAARLSANAFACVALLHGVFAFAQRAIDLPAEPRLLPLVASSLAAAAWEPISELGQPREALLITAALLVGELLGHPFELRSRNTFAREVAAVPNAAATAATAMHPLTLRFADDALERAYGARSFGESYLLVFSFAVVSCTAELLLAISLPPTRLPCAAVGSATLLMLRVRVNAAAAPDQAAARERFGWAWCSALSSMAAVVAVGQRRYAFTGGLGVRSFACVAAIHFFHGLFQRTLGMAVEPRCLTLLLVVLGRAAMYPSASELGQHWDTLLVAAALIVGELFGHPFEVRRRAAFAREAVAAGRVPDEAPAARLVHPLTLRFSDGNLERAYAARSFGESYPVVVAFCLAFSVLTLLLAWSSPTTLPASVTAAAGLLSLLAYRARLAYRAKDQATARSRFAWAWASVWAVRMLALSLLQRSRALSGTGLRMQTMGPAQHAGAVLAALIAIFQRFSAMPAPQRLVVIGTFITARATWPATSDIGQPYETLLFAAALLVGELLGYPFELGRRHAFAREANAPGGAPAAAAAAAAATATADAATAMHPITLRFVNGRLEHAYAARSFGEAYHVVVTTCLVLAALLALAALLIPGSLHVNATAVAALLSLLALRARLRRSPDQVQALAHFAHAWCALCALSWGGAMVAQRYALLRFTQLSAQAFAFIAALYTLLAALQRIIALPATPRLLTLLTFGLGHALTEPFSELGHPNEALLVGSALLVGELLGHPFELNRRVLFVHEAAAAGRDYARPRPPQLNI